MNNIQPVLPVAYTNTLPSISEEETSEEQTPRAQKRPADRCTSAASECHGASPLAKGRKIKCLCADDNELLRSVMEKMLTGLGFEPDVVKNGKEAFDLLQKKSDNYLFTVFDMDMGVEDEMNGHIAIKRWRKREEELKLKPLPMFILSGNNDQESVSLCFKCGATDVMSKPATKKVLEETIKKHTAPSMAERHAFPCASDRSE